MVFPKTFHLSQARVSEVILLNSLHIQFHPLFVPPAPAAPEIVLDILVAGREAALIPGPDAPAIAVDPGAAAEPAESIFKDGPRNAAEPPQ